MRALKYILLGLGLAVLLAGAILTYVAATFDPNQYKPEIVQAVKEKTQRTLRLEGEIGLTLFPTVGARLGKTTLSERASDKEFARVDNLSVAVKLWPLLSRQVVVDAVEVKGLRAQVIRYKDGRTNIDDLAGTPKPGPAPGKGTAGEQVAIDIARVRVEDSALTYVDQSAGAKYEVHRLNLKTGRIASGVPTDIDLAFAARADKPKLDVEAALKTRLTFDPEKQRYAFDGLDLTSKGSVADVSDFAASMKGSVDARPGAREITASRLSLTAKGKRAGEDFSVKADVPGLSVTTQKVSGERIAAEATLGGGKRKLAAKMEIPSIAGTAGAFKTDQIVLALDQQEETARTTLKLTSPLNGSVEREQIELPKFTAVINVKDPKLPASPVDATVNGSLLVDAAKQTAHMNFATRFDESTIKGRAGLARFTPPAYTFDIDIDKLDADRYMAKGGSKGAPSDGAKGKPDARAKQPEQPFDLAALKDLNANGSLRIGALKASNVKAANVKVELKAANGRMDLSPIAASLYQGSLAGAVGINASATPTFTVRQRLSGISIGPLLRDLADNDMLEGRGNVTVDLTSRGNTVSALKKTLNGTASVHLTDGAVKGIDIAGTIRGAKAKLGTLRGEQVQQANKGEKTDFSELTATFNVKDGVAHNNDLSIKSPLLRIGGAGSVNVGEDTIDYLVKASIVATTRGQGGRDLADLQGITVPVRVTGALDSPSYSLDFAALVTDAAKQKVEQTLREQIERRLGGGAPKEEKGGSLRDQLKGLFGR